jgi:hypothetical protein
VPISEIADIRRVQGLDDWDENGHSRATSSSRDAL